RIWEHKNNLVSGFTQKYKIHALVYYEIFSDSENAILREKRLKKWKREWKIRLIEENNPDWKDLYSQIV
ncbi:MAG TPA: GIY-YIG nuclease family protein, partial [Gammaproteobacteria bacterium]